MIVTPTNPGRSGWLASLPQSKKFMRLEKVVNADYAIIGAGFAGLSAAAYIAQKQPEARIVVVEAEGIAEGSSGRNSGFMIDLPHDLSSDHYVKSESNDKFEIEMNRYAIQFAKNMRARHNMPSETLLAIGKINAYIGEKYARLNQDFAAHLDKLGEKYELLDDKKMKEITGTSVYRGGLLTPGAVLVQPALYIQKLAEGLSGEKVQIFTHSPVKDFHQTGDHWVMETKKGKVLAPKVILAVNGMIERFGFFPDRLIHIFTYAAMTKSIEEISGSSNWGITPSAPFGTSVRRITDASGKRLLVRNRFTYNPNMEVSEKMFDDVNKELRTAFELRFPQHKDVPFEYVWGGRLCLSRNNVPAFGEVEKGLYSACCQNGLGTTKGTFNGVMAAKIAIGEESDLLDRFKNLGQPRKLPMQPFRNWGIKANMARRQSKSKGE